MADLVGYLNPGDRDTADSFHLANTSRFQRNFQRKAADPINCLRQIEHGDQGGNENEQQHPRQKFSFHSRRNASSTDTVCPPKRFLMSSLNAGFCSNSSLVKSSSSSSGARRNVGTPLMVTMTVSEWHNR